MSLEQLTSIAAIRQFLEGTQAVAFGIAPINKNAIQRGLYVAHTKTLLQAHFWIGKYSLTYT